MFSILFEAFVGFAFKMLKLLNLGKRFRNHHGILLVEKQELLFIIEVDRFYLFHETVEEHMLLEIRL